MKVGPAPAQSQSQTQRSNGTSSTERQRKEIRQAQHNEQQEHQHNVKHANTIDICLLGIAIVIGGQFFSWNVSLAAGFWECLLGLILTGMGYLCLVLCMAEMNSALPFSGGSYGFVRVCIGPYFGYLVGCCEALQNIAYVTASVIPFGQMLTRALGTSVEYEPLWWAFFYITAIGINVMGGSVFWNCNRVIGLISLLFLLVYILGTAKFCDFNKFSESDVAAYEFNGTSFVSVYPVIAFFFIGVESLPLVCVDCENPQSQIPYGMTSCYIILACTAIGTFFTVTSQFPGTAGAADELLPLNDGFERLFGISDMSATWFTIPTIYATGFGFMFIYGRQMSSMARSGLFPSIFKYKTKFSNTPFAALIGGSIASMILLLVIYYTDVTLLDPLFDTCIIASYFVYIAVFISYFIFRYRYQALPRSFRNPLGVWGGLIGICVFLIGIISALGFQDHDNEPFYFFIVYIAILIVYYFFYGFYDQRLSDEEQKILFRAYVVNANIMKKGKRSAVASNQSRGGRSRVSVQSRASNISGNSSNVNGKIDEALAEEEMDEEADESVLNESDISSVPGTVAASVFTKANSVIPPSPTHRSLHSLEHRTLRKHSINSLEPSPEEPEETSPERQELVNYSTNVPRGSFHEPRRRQSNISNNSSEPVVDGKKRSFFRRSFESLTDRARDVIDNVKLLPRMEDQIRAEYEQILLQAMRRNVPTEVMSENENELPMERDENSPKPKEEV